MGTTSTNADGTLTHYGTRKADDYQPLTPGSGFKGTGTLFYSGTSVDGGMQKTTIFIDLTGAASSTTDLDIIGTSGASTLGLLGNKCGTTCVALQMTCLEAPAGGVTDIDLYEATESTGAFDGGIAALTETALITSGAAWTNGAVKAATTCPVIGRYLYLTGGAAGTAATYTAGKFLIEIWCI
jgi:hypothetical protein